MKGFFYWKCIILLLCYLYNCYCASPNRLRSYLQKGYSRMLPFQDCGSIYDILQLSISGCTASPCQMPLGDTVKVVAEFNDYGDDVHVLKHEAYWVLNAVNTKAYVTPESCDGKSCPFRGFEGMAFTANLLVNNSLPALRGTLFWEVKNQTGIRVMCYKIPISIIY